MITIAEKEEHQDIQFASKFYFERTEQFKSKLSELNCTELRDLSYKLLNELEKIYGAQEIATNILSEILGWKDVV